MIRKEGEEIVIPTAVIKRLPKYHRHLSKLIRKGVEKISSKDFGQIVGVSAPQLRQDLNHFGNFGQQGYGYNIEKLYNELSKVMGIEKKSNMVLIGVGNLGQALINSTDFKRRGFYLSAAFDINPRLVGMMINGIKVRDIETIESYIRENDINIAIITVPEEAAQKLADRMIDAGVKGIWNFAPVDLKVPKGVSVENEHLTEGLLRLSFKVKDDKK
ncbi:redox-sensing transcriptional repressor Rex [Orenia marismortui]|uniref:redox-sensing transcriptional repressor Rex n=1 Tax=Orenia marismortui TaxID=46469 RepID=UPI00035DFB62|nr:redox-sensing transcriptional repressor Rex [Orenia marismortui]